MLSKISVAAKLRAVIKKAETSQNVLHWHQIEFLPQAFEPKRVRLGGPSCDEREKDCSGFRYT
jgi:hypothetical protein